jgi:hypothetical protein
MDFFLRDVVQKFFFNISTNGCKHKNMDISFVCSHLWPIFTQYPFSKSEVIVSWGHH